MSVQPKSLSICMIVRNEAHNLPRILGSLDGLWDQLVIVDTGSEDNTIEVAQSYGAEIHLFRWCKDFSAARNYSISKATGDWVGIFDGDEELEEADRPVLTQYLQQDGTKNIIIQCLNERSIGWSMHPMTRFFRRGKGEFKGIVHNQLLTEGENTYLPVRMYHYGYNLPPDQQRKKHERSLELLQIEHEREPESTYCYRNTIRLLRGMGEFDSILNWAYTLDKGLESGQLSITDGSFQSVCLDTGIAHYKLFQVDEAIKVFDAAIEKWPDFIDAYFNLAHIYFGQKDYEKTVDNYQAYLQLLHEAKTQLVLHRMVESWGQEFVAYNNLGIAFGYLGEDSKSHQCFKTAGAITLEGIFDNYYRVCKVNRIGKRANGYG